MNRQHLRLFLFASVFVAPLAFAAEWLAESAVDESQPFSVCVRVEGKRIQVQVNDRHTVDYTEPKGVQRPPERSGRLLKPHGGAITLQAALLAATELLRPRNRPAGKSQRRRRPRAGGGRRGTRGAHEKERPRSEALLRHSSRPLNIKLHTIHHPS